MISARNSCGFIASLFLLAPFPGVLSPDAMQLFHRDLGGAGRPPLVILHGMLGSSRNWQTTGRDLAAHFHVFALDLRNHGQSPHTPEMTYAAMAEDLRAWLEAQQLTRVTLMGHSLGGKIAMLFACEHPAHVERLIIVDIAPKDYFWPARRGEFDAMQAIAVERLTSRADAEIQLETAVPDWAMRKFFTTNLERDAEGRWRWVVDLPAIAASLAVLEKNALAANDHYDGTTLLITGGKSNYVDAADWPAVQAHFTQARHAILAEAGHNPHLDAREAFVRCVLSST